MNADGQQALADVVLKFLVFEMYSQGVSQAAIAKYVGKANKSINDTLKPLAKWDGRGAKK